MTERDLIVGIDLGGTQFRVCLADATGTIIRRQRWDTNAQAGPSAVIERMEAAVRETVAPEGLARVAGIGVGAPGPLNPWQGVVLGAPNLPGWNAVPLRDMMQNGLGVPVYLGNDANLAALGELYFGAGQGLRNIVYITVSTGVGGGVISDGHLLLGANGLAGEIGHMTIEANGPRCACGNLGCLEALASGTAIAREARARLATGTQTAMRDLAHGDPERVTAVLVEQAARQGDAVAAAILHTAATYLGIGVVNVLHLFDPEMVIIGGGVSQAGELVFDPVFEVVQQRAMLPYRARTRIVRAQLADDAGLMGALALVMSEGGR